MDLGIIIVCNPETGVWTMRKNVSDANAIIFLESIIESIKNKETDSAVEEAKNIINGKAQ